MAIDKTFDNARDQAVGSMTKSRFVDEHQLA
jgi:hypothetical protein